MGCVSTAYGNQNDCEAVQGAKWITRVRYTMAPLRNSFVISFPRLALQHSVRQLAVVVTPSAHLISTRLPPTPSSHRLALLYVIIA